MPLFFRHARARHGHPDKGRSLYGRDGRDKPGHDDENLYPPNSFRKA